jgi:hypothetical protein
LDELARTKIESRLLVDYFQFDNISLWQFVPERCYLGSAGALQETIELIELLGELIDRYHPTRLRLLGCLKDHQKIAARLMAQRHEMPIEFGDNLPSGQSRKPSAPVTLPRDPFVRRLEEGNGRAIQEYISQLRKSRPNPGLPHDPVLVVSFPRVWTETESGRVDQYYDAFLPILRNRNLSPLRLELPYYFQINGSVHEYINRTVQDEAIDPPTVFFDEFIHESFQGYAVECRSMLQQTYDRLIHCPEFLDALSWKGISLLRALPEFWHNVFVEHLAMRCIPAMLVARRILAQVRPRAILAIYETGLYSRALIIEAHRAGIPSFGLQHALILPEHEYYLHDRVSHRPDLKQYFDGLAIPSKTLVHGNQPRKVLTGTGHYPEDAVAEVGCDWRYLDQNRPSADHRRDLELRRRWFTSTKKIALVLTQPSLAQGVIEQVAEKLPASEYAVLVKLHPDDKDGQSHREHLARKGFEVQVIGDYLKESIRLADVIFASIYSSTVVECLFLHKRVYTDRGLEIGYTVPWEPYTDDMAKTRSFGPLAWTEDQIQSLDLFLRDIGYNAQTCMKDFACRIHRLFDQMKIGTQPSDPARISEGPGPSSSQPAGRRDSELSPTPPVFENEPFRNCTINYANFFHEVNRGKRPDLSVPLIRHIRRISFQLSNLCNYSHVHKRCPLHQEKDKRILPSRVIGETLDELAAVGFDGVVAFHIYNEPLIDPRLFQLIREVRNRCPSAKVLLLTNGFYLNQTLADEISDLEVWNLAVSAYTHAEYARLVHLTVRIPYTVFFAKLDDRQNQYQRDPMDIRRPCDAPVGDLSIGPDGSVILCCLDWKGQHVFGNLLNESLSSILSKESIRSVYRDLLGGNRSLHLCRRCDWVR